MNRNELIHEIEKWIPDIEETLQCMKLSVKMQDLNKLDLETYDINYTINNIMYLIEEYEKERARRNRDD